MSICRPLLMIAVLLVVCAAAACGGGGGDEPQSDEEQIADIVKRFDAAFAGGDYGEACDLLHSRRKEHLEFEQGKKCPAILEDFTKTTVGSLVAALADARITYVRIAGDQATVGIEGNHLGSRQAVVERDGDEWRVAESAAGL